MTHLHVYIEVLYWTRGYYCCRFGNL